MLTVLTRTRHSRVRVRCMTQNDRATFRQRHNLSTTHHTHAIGVLRLSRGDRTHLHSWHVADGYCTPGDDCRNHWKARNHFDASVGPQSRVDVVLRILSDPRNHFDNPLPLVQTLPDGLLDRRCSLDYGHQRRAASPGNALV